MKKAQIYFFLSMVFIFANVLAMTGIVNNKTDATIEDYSFFLSDMNLY